MFNCKTINGHQQIVSNINKPLKVYQQQSTGCCWEINNIQQVVAKINKLLQGYQQ